MLGLRYNETCNAMTKCDNRDDIGDNNRKEDGKNDKNASSGS